MNSLDGKHTQLNNFISLQDGRKLAYATYGAPNGFPILAFHGTPGSRIWFVDDDPVATLLGIRLITIDRPGYGLSDPMPKRKVLDFAEDVKQLIQQLELEEVSVMGVSGGGVYAAACAFAIPENIYKVGLVATINEFDNGKPPKEMSRPNRISIALAKRFPWLLNFYFNQQKKLMDHKPEVYKTSAKKNLDHLCESDQAVMRKPETAEAMLLHMQEALRKGVKEPAYEIRLVSRKWGFDASQIQIPVEVWHGTADTLAPISGIKGLVEKVPDCNANYVEEKGHFLDEDPDVWEAILKSLRK